MPKISEFYGISIYIYYRDHGPPHFHVSYGGQDAVVGIETLALIRGRLSPKTIGLVMEWASVHQADLLRVWEQSRDRLALDWIEPLS